MRAYKTVNDAYIEPISFTVPRRAEVFQSDIFPPATGSKSAVSAAEWLAGKDGVPAKIDLESVYDGNAPVEVPSDYKPSAPAPAASPVKAPVQAKKEPEPIAVVTQRAPPPTMTEQKGSISAMASKYQDNEVSSEDEPDSPFDDLASLVRGSGVGALPDKNDSPTKTLPPKPSPVSQPTVRVSPPAASISRPVAAPAANVSEDSSIKATMEQIKSLVEKQSDKITALTHEVETLKTIVSSSNSSDPSGRIRELELELEAYRD